MTEHQVFISYSHSDADWAQKFARSLQDIGVPVWLDQFELTPGSPWQDELEAALRGSDVFAFLIHPDKLNSPLLSFELGVALSLKKNHCACGSSRIGTIPPSFTTASNSMA